MVEIWGENICRKSTDFCDGENNPYPATETMNCYMMLPL